MHKSPDSAITRIKHSHMNPTIGERYISELTNLFHIRGHELYDGQHSLSLTTACLHFIQKKQLAIYESHRDVRTTKLQDVQHICDCLSKVISLKLVSDRKHTIAPSLVHLNLSMFNALQSLELKRVPISSLTNLQKLRQQLRVLVIHRSNITNIEDLIVSCGGDRARAFAWNNLRELDLSINSISCLGDSLKYLPELESINISSNHIGPCSDDDDDITTAGIIVTSSSSSLTGSLTGSCTSLTGVDRSNGLLAVSGIQYIDKVKSMHLGFNRLTCVPEFGGRAKFSLTVLILRHNLLKDVKGVEVLDSLIELDIYGNLISKMTNLQPLYNLHHLNILWMEGNPICYDAKYRFNLMKCLSNLISRNTFQLDGKRLSNSERKNISSSLTHFPSTPAVTSASPPDSNRLTHSMGTATPILVPEPHPSDSSVDDHLIVPLSLPIISSPPSTTINATSSRKSSIKKKPRVVVLDDDSIVTSAVTVSHDSNDDTQDVDIPLLNEKRLTKNEDMRSLLKESWLSTVSTAPVDNPFIADEPLHVSSNGHPHSHSSSTNNIGICPDDDDTSLLITSVVYNEDDVIIDQLNGSPVNSPHDIFPMDCETKSLDRFSPVVKGPTPQVLGDIFEVSIVDSDTDDDRLTDPNVWIVITDRFLQEMHNAIVQDQLDLQCLRSAVIEEKKHKGETKAVLVLHFDYDRRDRRKREYILNNPDEQKHILGQLIPIVQANTSDVSIATKLECFKCQMVIDHLEALDAPSDSPAYGSYHSVSSHVADVNKKGKLCPHCKGYLIQIGSNSSHNIPDTSNESTEDVLSPGHIDLSTFANYPSEPEDDDYFNFKASKPPRLSPVPPSPFPDMSPFHTPLKSISTTNDTPADGPHIEQLTSSSFSKSEEMTSNDNYPDTSPVRMTQESDQYVNGPNDDDQPISGSVPIESKLKSYIINALTGKGRKDDITTNKTHKRSKSQDIHIVPPLPLALKHRSIDKLAAATSDTTSTTTNTHTTTHTATHGTTHTATHTATHGTTHSAGSDSRTSTDISSTNGSRRGTELGGSSGGERKSSGSSSGSKLISKYFVTSTSRQKKNKLGSSSGEHKQTSISNSTTPSYKDDDPTYIHNNMQLYLNMEVFGTSEHFQLALKSSVVEYGDWNEMECFIIISTKGAYIYRIIAPESLIFENWLELKSSLKLRDLVYIEIGAGYQSLRLEFDNSPRCYTFLIRNEDKCRHFYDKLSYVVSDVPKSIFKGVKVSQFYLTYLKDPSRSLRETVLNRYDKYSNPDSLACEDSDNEKLKVFVLAYKYNPHNVPIQFPVTLVLTNIHIYLALDNPQWPLPRLHPLPAKSDLLPPYSGVIERHINDVEKLILYDDQNYQFTLQFFKESTLDEDTPTWTIITKTCKSLQKFVKTLEEAWFEQFQLNLPKEFK